MQIQEQTHEFNTNSYTKAHSTQSTDSGNSNQEQFEEETNTRMTSAAESILRRIKNKSHIQHLKSPGTEPLNLFKVPKFKEPISYKDDGKRNLVRTKEGLIVLKHVPMMKIQAGIATSVLKQVAKKVLTGKGLRGLNLPIQIFESSTYLQQSALGLALLPKLLKKAAEYSNPQEQIKNILAFLCTLSNFSIVWKQPLNPILGETHSAFLDDDTEIHLEQVSHHPPISYFYITNKLFKCYGHFKASPKLRLPNVSVQIDGRMNIQFLNSGNRFILTQPNIKIKGVMTGGRKFIIEGNGYVYGLKSKGGHNPGKTLFDPSDFEDERYFSQVHFGGGKSHGFFGKKKGSYDFYEGETVQFSDEKTAGKLDDYFLGKTEKIRGKVKISKVISKAWSKKKFSEENTLHRIEGNWTDEFKINSDEYNFCIKEEKIKNVMQSTSILPSDSCFREDLLNMRTGDLKAAQKCKKILEENQRYDAKLRKKGKKRNN